MNALTLATTLNQTLTAFEDLRAKSLRLLESLSVEQIHATREKLIPRLRRELIRMFRRQGRRSLARWLPSLRANGLLEASVPFGLWQLLQVLLEADETHWAERFSSIMEEAATAAGVAMAADFALSGSFLDFPVQRVIDEIRQNSLALVRNLNRTTVDQIRTILEQGIENHLSYTAVAKQIRDRFREMGMFTPGGTGDRASRIAVHEIGQAYTAAQMSIGHAMKGEGLTMEKFWQTVEDDRVETECEENQAAGWIPFDDSFPSGDDAPLAHVGCRCAILIRRAQD